MARRWRRGLLMVAAAVLLVAGGASAEDTAPSRVVSLRADPWCPYNCDPASDKPGFAIEIARAVLGAKGHAVDYKLLSWSRTLVEVRSGAIDGAVAGIKADAPDFVYPQEELGFAATAFAVRKGSGWRWAGPKSLDGKVLGIIPDYQYFPELKSYIEAHAKDPRRVQPVAMFNALELNLKKLAAGRVDLVPDDVLSLRYAIDTLGLGDKLAVVPGPPERDALYVSFSPAIADGADLAAAWDRGVRDMRADGRLAAILSRYGVKDWK